MMFEFIQFYRANKSKSIGIIIEVLYTFSLLIFATELYGKSIKSLMIEANTFSKNFFIHIISIGLVYVFVAFTAKLFAKLILSIVSWLINYVLYKRKKAVLKKKERKNFSFKLFIDDPKNIPYFYNLTRITFKYVKQEKLSELKMYFVNLKGSSLATKFFIILSSYLIISMSYVNFSFGILDAIASVGIFISITFYYLFLSLERIILSPGFMNLVEDERQVYFLEKGLIKNDACKSKNKKKEGKSDNEHTYFVFDPIDSSKIIGWIIIVDRSMLKSQYIRKILEKPNEDNSAFKILVDTFDLIPDEYSDKDGLKILKPQDQSNLDKEISSLVLSQTN